MATLAIVSPVKAHRLDAEVRLDDVAARFQTASHRFMPLVIVQSSFVVKDLHYLLHGLIPSCRWKL